MNCWRSACEFSWLLLTKKWQTVRHVLFNQIHKLEMDAYQHEKQTHYFFYISMTKSANMCSIQQRTLYRVLYPFPVAQMVEHGTSNAKIMGSIPRESKS